MMWAEMSEQSCKAHPGLGQAAGWLVLGQLEPERLSSGDLRGEPGNEHSNIGDGQALAQ